jgi:hypothetical protein
MCGKRGWFLWPIFREGGSAINVCHACGKSGFYKMHKHSFGYFGEELRRPHFLPNAMEIMTRLMGFTSVGGNESQFIFLANALWFL